MTCSTDNPQQYTILFQKLADARCAQDNAERTESDRVIDETDRIKAVRELAEAASEEAEVQIFTRA